LERINGKGKKPPQTPIRGDFAKCFKPSAVNQEIVKIVGVPKGDLHLHRRFPDDNHVELRKISLLSILLNVVGPAKGYPHGHGFIAARHPT
jgi:hypothetical protein